MTDNPKTYSEFCLSLNELLCDANFPSENIKTIDFLEAMEAWLSDTKGGKGFFDDCENDTITWSDLLKLLQASAVYE